MRSATVTLTALAALAGCGDDTETAKTPATAATAVTIAGAPQAVEDCVAKMLYKARPAGNATRIATPGGRQVANITAFGSAAEAARFDRELVVPNHAQGGRLVAVFLADAKPSDRRSIGACLDA